MSEGSRFARTGTNIFYLREIDLPKVEVSPEVTHHILVVDRSGSMWGDIEKLKQSLEQALAVESAMNGSVETSLISFSTDGDVTLHWSKVTADDVMKLNNPFLGKLRSIRATFLTGISQGLRMALGQVDETQTTGITLFTDGYANSPSSFSENQALDAFVADASQNPRLFMNCIGYRSWCDWPRMTAMANALSGKCVKAATFKDVLDSMRDTQELLAGNVCPAVNIKSLGDGSLLMAINRTTGQVNATRGDLQMRGISESDDVSVYAVLAAEPTYNIPKGVKALSKDDAYLYGAMAIGFASLSDLRTAKEVLFDSGNKTLWEEHQSAMTPSTLSAMLDDLSGWVAKGNNEDYEMGRNTRPKFNLFDLASVLDGLPSKSIGISDEFYEGYRRRSLKRVPGKREEDGTITPPNAELVPNGRVYIRGVSFNTSDASVQLETIQDTRLRNLSTGEFVDEIQFINVATIPSFRSYTLISAGERNVERIPLEAYTEQAWKALHPFMVPSEIARGFKPGRIVRLELKKFRLDTDTCPSAEVILQEQLKLQQATARVKALSAMLNKGEASPMSPDQVDALKHFHLSPAMYFSPPTTYHYTDRDEAVEKGEIDSYTRYKVFFGTTGILNKGAFKSGNAFLAKRYKVTDEDGNVAKKPNLQGYLQGDTYEVKPPGRGAWADADNLLSEVFDEILLGERLSNEAIGQELAAQKEVVGSAESMCQGLVMEIGCTGLLPSQLESSMTRYEPEDFAKKFGVKLKKAEAEGLFYVADNGLVLSIVPETSWYTVQVSEQAAAAK